MGHGDLGAELGRGAQRPVRVAQELARETTRSAWPVRITWSACAGEVMSPTAPVGDARLPAHSSAFGVW